MKKLFFVLMVIATFCKADTQKTSEDTLTIHRKGYTVLYSQKLREPLKVWYTVGCNVGANQKEFNRDGLTFKTVHGVLTTTDQDYSGNDYDKGHLAPAENYTCDKEMLVESFLYINCSLQNAELNRVTWKLLEEYEHKLHDAHVLVELIFSPSSRVMPSGAVVPDGFRKTILYSGHKEVYYFPNVKPSSHDFRKYKM